MHHKVCTAFPRVSVQDTGNDRGRVLHAICLWAETRSQDLNVPIGLEVAITWVQHVDLWQSREEVGYEREKSGKIKTKRETGKFFW